MPIMKNALQAFCMLLLCASPVFSQNPVQKAVQAFTSQTGALATIDNATGSLSFLRFPSQTPFRSSGQDAVAKSSAFFKENSQLLGMRSGVDDFRFVQDKAGDYGLQTVILQQTYRGVPVFDGIMKFHYAGNLGLTNLNGNYITDIKVNPAPSLAQAEAERLAIAYLAGAGEKPLESPLRVHKSAIYIFQKGLVQGYKGTSYLVYEVEVRNDAGLREFLYIEAHDGRLIEQFTGTHGIHRTLYQTSINSANIKWNEGDQFPGTLDIWQQSEVETSAFIYNLMKNTFGRVSYDGLDAPMITVHNSPSINCPNANWNGVSANYCTGTASDDVVAHEWGHAYTEYTSGLIYAWQSGAINEAYSDIWGETVDLLNDYMDEGENKEKLRSGCNSSSRWQIGEKSTGFGGALRDMWNPTCVGDPGKMSDSQFFCGNDDDGGVHINSGVLNHAFALLVDGGKYNGQTITGIGLTKAAHIFWRAQSEYMTRTTDFAAQADMLEAAAADLLGQPLKNLTTGQAPVGNSGKSITDNDLVQLTKVIAAVEMRRESNCGFQTIFSPAPPLCEGAKPGLALFSEDFEAGLGAFTTAYESSSAAGEKRKWTQKESPDNHGKAAFADNYSKSDCSGPSQEGLIWLRSPEITIPSDMAGNLNLAFDHYVATEDSYDGGNIKYKVNNGPWTLIPAAAFTANPYNNVIAKYLTTFSSGTNPLAGQPAFSGTDNGTVSGSWGQSQVDLSSLGIKPGDVLRLSWEFGTDYCFGYDGWYVDNVSVYSCAVTPAVHFAQVGTTINEGEAEKRTGCLNYVDRKITVQIDKAPSAPVTLTFNNPGGTAKNGSNGDYTISPASVTLQNGALSADINIRVYDDAYIEGPETVALSYQLNANGGDAFAATEQQVFTLTIADDDLPPGNYTEDLLFSKFNLTQEGWKVINGGTSPNTWALVSLSSQALDPQGRPFFRVIGNDIIRTGHVTDEILESPAINTEGKKNLTLSFSQGWLPFEDGVPETGMVDIWDGQQWHNVYTVNEADGPLGSIFTGTPDIRKIKIPDQYANVNMKVRFHFSATLAYHWAIDNVRLSASNSTEIMTAVTSGDGSNQYLGPNETAVFYDPGTGNLIAKIKNLTDHDYGCTTVAVDRAGKDETSWLGGYSITKKTFRVTPELNDPNGKYEITLYYKASELPNFNGSDITSMGKSEGGIGPANTAVTSFAEVQVSSAFDKDLAYTSRFDSGFSGFGLSNAPAAGALPVTLVDFTGEHMPDGNMLHWKTASETDNWHFLILRSYDGRNFEEIGQVAGRGTTGFATNYSFTDPLSRQATTYYRLKQVDLDGTSSLSKIITLSADKKPLLKFFPNPVQSELVMELPKSDYNHFQIKVVDASGRIVMSVQQQRHSDGTLRVDMHKLSSGIYQVLLSAPGMNYNIPILKF